MSDHSLDFEWAAASIPFIYPVADPDAPALAMRKYRAAYVASLLNAEGFDLPNSAVDQVLRNIPSSAVTAAQASAISSAGDAVLWVVDDVRNGTFLPNRDTLRRCNWMLMEHESSTAGDFRTEPVHVPLRNGHTFTAPAPEALDECLESGLSALENIPDLAQRSLALLPMLMRGQFFAEGNLRTALHMVNATLISHGYPYIEIPPYSRLSLEDAIRDTLIDDDATNLLKLLSRF